MHDFCVNAISVYTCTLFYGSFFLQSVTQESKASYLSRVTFTSFSRLFVDARAFVCTCKPGRKKGLNRIFVLVYWCYRTLVCSIPIINSYTHQAKVENLHSDALSNYVSGALALLNMSDKVSSARYRFLILTHLLYML